MTDIRVHQLPAGTISCTIGAFSDTVSTIVTRLAKPLIVKTGNILQLANLDTAAAFTWQRLDSATNAWQSIGSATTVTLSQSASYRVDAAKSTCHAISDAVNYTKPASTRTPPAADSGKIKYYPNPASTVLALDSLNTFDGWLTLEILDGQTGRRISITPIAGRTWVEVPVAYLNNTATKADAQSGDMNH
ncbi:MAG TPA: hypothetical protein VHE34_30905 [Puia sp.]|uniref:hypothetical protein n=1 Tax=Puia sp. TaxID=2045100 RepID=UPI002CC34C0E|nr:hypothetical protein [Puia sp.]HVU99686.1 hypothetical protein [Puia sp.]